MKKTYFTLCALILAALILGSCGSSPAGAGASGPANANTPEWLNDFPPEDVLWGIGSAKQSTENLSMTMADARARQEVARQLSVLAEGMVKDYARDAGTVGNQTSLQLAESVARQLTSAQLSGATPIKRWKAPDGTWWYLVQMKKADAAKAAAGVIDNEAARYAEFKSMEALKEMDALLSKSSVKPQVIGD